MKNKIRKTSAHYAKSESVTEKKLIKLIEKISEFRIIDDMMIQIKSLDSKR